MESCGRFQQIEVSFGDFQQFFHCWTKEFERVGRCEAVLKGKEEENFQSA